MKEKSCNSELVTIGFVTHNSGSVIEESLKSLYELLPLIVVDNASIDSTLNRVRAVCPNAELYCNTSNIGFGRACNILLHKAKTEYVLILNPDVKIYPSDVDALVEAGKINTDAAILAPMLRFPDGRVQRSFLPFSANITQYEAHKGSHVFSVNHVIGAAMLLHRNRILDLGGFDEALFFYGEDEDLCRRVRSSNYRILIVPSARAFHTYGASSLVSRRMENWKAWCLSWSRLYVLKKHEGYSSMLWYAFQTVLFHLPRSMILFVIGRQKDALLSLNRFLGVLAYLTGRPCLPYKQ
mgnify:CR=1 FL=1